MAQVIVVTSGKGGVGKTIVTSLLGRALAKNRQKVVLIDGDFGLKNLDMVLNLESRVIYDLEDVAKGRATIRQALVQDKKCPSLFLLAASSRFEISENVSDYLEILISQLQNDFDFILIDSPAGIENGFHNALKVAKMALVVITLDKTSLLDADKVIGLLKNHNLTNISLVVNRYMENSPQLSLDELHRLIDIPILGFIEEDAQIRALQNYGKEISSSSKCEYSFMNMASKLMGKGEITLPQKKWYEKLFKATSKS